MNQEQTDATAGPGGVMTEEVGVVTGELTVRTQVDDDGGLICQVQYKDADEWYRITGAPSAVAGADLDTVHAQLVARVSAGDG